jgi:hypothetical protein
MVGDHPIVDQAHEMQSLAKELKYFNCVLLDKFVAGGIIETPSLVEEFCYFSKA